MIGYYVHHHGVGHLQRARAIRACLGGRLTLIGSFAPGLPPPPVLRLARDDEPPPALDEDVDAAGALHWAPLRHPGLRQRHETIAAWLADERAQLLVSDVSMEVVLLARLLSVPPVVVAQRGRRDDRPHVTGYDAAVAIVAPWPRSFQHDWPARWSAKTAWVGMISRYDGRPRDPLGCGLAGRCVVVMVGRGGTSLAARHLDEMGAVAATHWHVLGGSASAGARPPGSVTLLGTVDDPWPWLCQADVVVSAAGASSIADVAAARAPLVAVAEHRPFDEQQHHADLLADRGLCVTAAPWPSRSTWPGLLDAAVALGGDRWAEVSDGQGARRAADTLLELADRDWARGRG